MITATAVASEAYATSANGIACVRPAFIGSRRQGIHGDVQLQHIDPALSRDSQLLTGRFCAFSIEVFGVNYA
jgi:hypothetical protein